LGLAALEAEVTRAITTELLIQVVEVEELLLTTILEAVTAALV
jgi:hypothetical protein